MRPEFLREEAAACRELADRLATRRDATFILRLADAFDALALERIIGGADGAPCSAQHGDTPLAA